MTPEKKLIVRFLTVFGEPKSLAPELFIEEFTKAIAGYPPDVLEKSGDVMIRKSTFWPKPAEVLAEVRRIGNYDTRRGLQVFEPCEDPPLLTDEQKERVRQIKLLAFAACDKAKEVLPPLAPLPSVDRDAFEAMRSGSHNPIHRKNIVRK